MTHTEGVPDRLVALGLASKTPTVVRHPKAKAGRAHALFPTSHLQLTTLLNCTVCEITNIQSSVSSE